MSSLNFKKILNPYFFLGILVLLAIGLVIAFLNPKAVAKVNGKLIYLKDFQRYVEAQKKYKSEKEKIDFSGPEGESRLKEVKKQVLDKMIENEIVKQEAEKFGISLTQDDIEKEYKIISETNGGEEKLLETITKNYGLIKEEFKKYILEPNVYKKRLEEKVLSSDEIIKDAKNKALEILEKLKKGENFAKLAIKESQDQISSQKGGDLGWIKKGEMVKEFEERAFSLKPGEISDVFRTNYGFHIIKVEEKSPKGDKVHVRQILIRTTSFSDWLAGKVKLANIKTYIKI